MITKIIFLISLLFFILLGFFLPDEMNMELMILHLIFVALIFLTSFLTPERISSLKGQYFKHSIFFLIGFVVVHFQHILDFVTGAINSSYSYIWVNEDVVLKALNFSVIGLTSFLLGYYFDRNDKLLGKRVKRKFEERPYKAKFLLWLSAFFLVSYFFTVNPLYLAGHYGEVEMGTGATYFILLFEVVVSAYIIQMCRNATIEDRYFRNIWEYIKYLGRPFFICLVVYLVSVMFSGDRGPIITFSLIFLSGYLMVTKFKIRLYFYVLFIILGGFLFTILGSIRSQDKSLGFFERFQSSLNKESRFPQKSILPFTQELATSIRAYHTTVNYIPERHDFLFGRFQYQQLSLGIPFFNPLNNLMFGDSHYKYRSSARFVTWINQGDFPYSGEGTTCLADFYFDFGLFGIVIGMLLFGYLFRILEVSMFSQGLPSLFISCMIITYIGNSIYIARSSFGFELRTVLWVFAILLINKYVFNMKRT
ncbi:O-antigen polymerase [Flavihumibacter sp. UBA7668]|uniref:O-antigen polymerase n=1 Tax=Flavihumibacter sp. UBA7668 TaxID=1946542 RepID=UPI0025C0893B|nr:O-antigen polymerase [Flavihumibacter sp. UBA7668]